LRAGFARQGLRFVLPSELRSNSITALWLPPGRSYAELHDGLKARGFIVYEGQGRLQREIFRVANMGHLRTADFERFLGALDEVLAR
jgi:2-aminoethylphosphonate-pyruvate transaminase